jgi:trehalose 6-phosphate synthase
VLVLSRLAGAADELESALLVDPLDTEGVAEALERALAMPLAERRERWAAAMAVLRENTAARWRERFLEALEATGS